MATTGINNLKCNKLELIRADGTREEIDADNVVVQLGDPLFNSVSIPIGNFGHTINLYDAINSCVQGNDFDNTFSTSFSMRLTSMDGWLGQHFAQYAPQRSQHISCGNTFVSFSTTTS